uniref:Uncharacterized protein n=1 Tax=Plectus sambesii TaxID=2011161 RepID=A0A914UIA8_9BILA
MSDEIVRTVIVDRLVPDLFRRGHPALAACSSVSLPEMDDDYSVGDLSELEAESAAETGKAIGAMSTTPSTDASPEPIPSIRWYHGRLTREEAEQRLGRDGAVGRFIVRESDNRPGNYVLSCIIGERHIMHYPVTFVCGHYFLAGQQFDSLESLVTYHLFSIDKKLPLSEPVEPSSQVLLKSRQRIAILPFSGMPDTDELSFIKGDIFTVHQDLDADWFWATLDRTDESGLVFSGLTEELTNNCVLPSRLPYFHPTDDVQELAGRMAAVGVDSFLVRPSGHVPQAFALMVNTGERIEKFLIRQTDDDRFELGGRRFASVNDIVERYKQTDICDGHRLQVPVLRVDYEAGAPLDRHEIETTGDGDSASQNAVLLVSFVQDLCDTIYESAATFPIVVRYILSLVRLKTASQWPDQPTVARRAVNSFVVLRLFSLALVDPRKFNLITGILPRLAGRNLIQAAKLVQTTANLSPPPVVQDNAKPDPIRSFVANSQPRMAAFLEEISSADEEQARIAATQRGGARMDVADDLALIAELTEGAAAGAVDETPVREARMVLELLRKHRDQYCGGGGGGS